MGDIVGVPCLGGGLQVGVTLNWVTKKNVFLIRYVHKICLTKVTFIVEKYSKSRLALTELGLGGQAVKNSRKIDLDQSERK